MDKHIINLTIDKLAGLGDGVAQHRGGRVFVPYTVPGDEVEAHILRRTKDAAHAELTRIVTPGQGRIPPVCRHFGICGGCSLQQLESTLYTDFKWQMAREAVRKAEFDPACVEPLFKLPAASRRRVELKMEEGKLGYYALASHRLVNIEECPVLEPGLEALVLRIRPQLIQCAGLDVVHINGVDNGYDITLTGGAGEKWELKDEAILRVSAAQGGTIRTLHQSAPVTITLGGVPVELPPRAFLQASRIAQEAMTARVLEAVGQAGRVLDLFSGIGTYSFPLAAHAAVTAIEGEAPMVGAMRQAAARHGVALKTETRDLFRSPIPAKALAAYDAVVINPPRTGAKEQCAALAQAKVKKLVMVSCNPATFTRDACTLSEGGYKLQKAVPIDQFVYSSHLEIIAEFAS